MENNTEDKHNNENVPEEPKKKNGSSMTDGIMLVACVYLIYLGVQMLIDFSKGVAEASASFNIPVGLIFIALGAVFGLRILIHVRKNRK